MASSQLSHTTPCDLPAVTLNEPVPAVQPGEELPSGWPSGNFECGGNEEGLFTEVVYGKRRRRRSAEGSSSVSDPDTIITQLPASLGLVVLFVPVAQARFDNLNPLLLRKALESLHLSCILDARINKTKHIVVVDTRNGQTIQSLLRLTSVCGIAVRGFKPRGTRATVSMLRDVDTSSSDESLLDTMCASAPIRSIRRMGTSFV